MSELEQEIPEPAMCWCGHPARRHATAGCKGYQRMSPWHSEPCVCHDSPEEVTRRAARASGS